MTYQSALPWVAGVLFLGLLVFVARAVYEARRHHTIYTGTRLVGGVLLALSALALALLFILA